MAVELALPRPVAVPIPIADDDTPAPVPHARRCRTEPESVAVTTTHGAVAVVRFRGSFGCRRAEDGLVRRVEVSAVGVAVRSRDGIRSVCRTPATGALPFIWHDI